MSFRSVFVALVIGFGLVLAGFLVNAQRPRVETGQPGADFVRGSGKCAECHTRQQHSIVHEYELSALTVGFLTAPFCTSVDRRFLGLCAVVLLVQSAVGLLGFYYHTAASFVGPSPRLWDNLINGAPPLAPLLFPNLALLAGLGLWTLAQRLPPGIPP